MVAIAAVAIAAVAIAGADKHERQVKWRDERRSVHHGHGHGPEVGVLNVDDRRVQR